MTNPAEDKMSKIPTRYRRVRRAVTAVQWDGSLNVAAYIAAIFSTSKHQITISEGENRTTRLSIVTPWGTLHVNPGDWVMEEGFGGAYPYAADRFGFDFASDPDPREVFADHGSELYGDGRSR